MFPPVQLASFAILLVPIANRIQLIFYVRNFTCSIYFIFLCKEHYFTDSATLPAAHQYTCSHTHAHPLVGSHGSLFLFPQNSIFVLISVGALTVLMLISCQTLYILNSQVLSCCVLVWTSGL